MGRAWQQSNEAGHELLPKKSKIMYCTAVFLREDFNLANGLIREIKIRKLFNMLHFVSRLQ